MSSLVLAVPQIMALLLSPSHRSLFAAGQELGEASFEAHYDLSRVVPLLQGRRRLEQFLEQTSHPE